MILDGVATATWRTVRARPRFFSESARFWPWCARGGESTSSGLSLDEEPPPRDGVRLSSLARSSLERLGVTLVEDLALLRAGSVLEGGHLGGREHSR